MSDSTTSTPVAQEQPPCTCCPRHTPTKQPVIPKVRSTLEQNFVNVTVRSAGVADRTRLFARTALEVPNLLQMKNSGFKDYSLYEVALFYIDFEINPPDPGRFDVYDAGFQKRQIAKEWKLQAWFEEIGGFVDFDKGSWRQVVYIADKFQMTRCGE